MPTARWMKTNFLLVEMMAKMTEFGFSIRPSNDRKQNMICRCGKYECVSEKRWNWLSKIEWQIEDVETNFNDFSGGRREGLEQTINNCRCHGIFVWNRTTKFRNRDDEATVIFIYLCKRDEDVVFLHKPVALNCIWYFYTGPLTIRSLEIVFVWVVTSSERRKRSLREREWESTRRTEWNRR